MTSLDASRPALEAAERNFALNPAISCPHELICGDAFAELKALAAAGASYDVVVIDPPSFARKKAEIVSARQAYGRLTKLGLAVLAKGGTLVLASCSSRITMDDFVALNIEAARKAGYRLEAHRAARHAVDHPVTFPEGAYLEVFDHGGGVSLAARRLFEYRASSGVLRRAHHEVGEAR